MKKTLADALSLSLAIILGIFLGRLWSLLDDAPTKSSPHETEVDAAVSELYVDRNSNSIAEERAIDIRAGDFVDIGVSYFDLNEDSLPESCVVTVKPAGPSATNISLTYGTTPESDAEDQFILVFETAEPDPNTMYRDINVDGRWDVMSSSANEHSYIWIEQSWKEIETQDTLGENKNVLVATGEEVHFLEGRWGKQGARDGLPVYDQNKVFPVDMEPQNQ